VGARVRGRLALAVATAACVAALVGAQPAAAATFTVTNTAASGTGSLAQAIADANAAGTGNTIAFDIPGTGPFVISPATSPANLAISQDNTTIDGCSQPGASCSGPPFNLQIQLKGYELTADADGITIKGLSITNVTSTPSGASGPGAIDTGRFVKNSAFLLASNLTIEDNYLGLAPDGTAAGNSTGVFLGTGVRSLPGLQGIQILNNVISGNTTGVNGAMGTFASSKVPLTGAVSGNVVGLDPTGTQPRPNGNGIVLDVTGNTQITNNTVEDNTGFGIRHLGRNQSTPHSSIATDPGTLIQGNTVRGNGGAGIVVGPNPAPSTDPYSGPMNLYGNTVSGNGGAGIAITQASDTIRPNLQIGGTVPGQANTISGNAGPGVEVGANATDTTIATTVRGNSIFGNTGPGIDLANDGTTPNGPAGVTRTGPNLLVNHPVISSIAHGPLVLDGTYAGPPNATFTLDFYSSQTASGPQTWMGSRTVTTDAGGNASFSFGFQTDVPAGSFVEATATDAGGDTSEFTSPMVVPPAADLSIAKTAATDPVLPGANEDYTLTVTNNGPDAAANVTVSDAVPAGLAFVSASPGCALAGTTVTCTLGSLASGGSQSFTVTGRASGSAGDAITNTATVGSDTADPNPSNNATSATIEIASADLSLRKSAAPRPAVPGRDETFKLEVSNAGPDAATNVEVSDPLPTGLSFVSAGSGCAFESGTVRCHWGSLASGQSHTFDVVARLASSLSHGVVNTATVTSDTPDPDPSNDSATASAPLGPKVDLELSKSESVSSVPAGGQVTYTLVVHNNGPSDASGVTVSDPLATALTAGSVATSQGSCLGSAGVICKLGALPAGGSAQVLVTATVSPSASGRVTNTASVTGEEPDVRPSNNSAGATLTALQTTAPQPVSDLTVAKRASLRRAYPGLRVTYTITVSNRGPDAATGVRLSDAASLGLQVRSIRTTQGSCHVGSPITCSLGTIAANARAVVKVVAVVKRTGIERNSASATSASRDPDVASNLATVRTTVTPLLRLRVSPSPRVLVAGQNVSYRIKVTNPTAAAVRRVTVCDRLPAGLMFLSASPHAHFRSGRYCWTIRRLAAGHARTLTVIANAAPGPGGRMVDHATADAPGARQAAAAAAVSVEPAAPVPCAIASAADVNSPRHGDPIARAAC
jgi:uncharacterized repeat protein (TIGR01451 family)